ncbi:hypothetical protein CEXT_600131 [Caerostris extrusa]|uniref:Uncharacterized protein n=1 Tax=Caerostris extrusa TaxID=172846 RepID=A0AAV4VV44_CAEEX|nr:hypothetical protein CEXT_600131 [Caerostris extrusa]
MMIEHRILGYQNSASHQVTSSERWVRVQFYDFVAPIALLFTISEHPCSVDGALPRFASVEVPTEEKTEFVIGVCTCFENFISNGRLKK